MNGRGEYSSADGKLVEGYFENDNFVRSLWSSTKCLFFLKLFVYVFKW